MEILIPSLFELSDLENLSMNVDQKSVFVEGFLHGLDACPKCSNKHLHRQSKRHRLFHLPPVGLKKAKLQVNMQRQFCVECKHSWWPPIKFSRGIERMTRSFVNYALDLLRFGTIKDVSQHLGVNWDVVKGLHKRFLEKEYKTIDVSDVEYVSIDEFSIAKRHKYMTTIMDIKTGRILCAVEGRKKKDIEFSLKDLKKKHQNLKLLPWT